MTDEKQVPEEEIFKAIGRLDEATKVMESETDRTAENEDQVVSFIAFLGRIVKAILAR